MAVSKILSFDPGTTVKGWAASTYDSSTGLFNVLKYGSLKPSQMAMKDKERVSIYGRRLITFELIECEVTKLIDNVKPDYMASEDVFLNHRNVQAFASLTLCLHSMAKASMSRGMILHAIPPRSVKLIVANDGAADKHAIQLALINNPNISIHENKQMRVEDMNEHEADAIGIGYAFAIAVLPTLETT